MKSILTTLLVFASLNTFAASKKMSCSVSENNVLVNKVEVELTDKVDRVEFGAINELTVILLDVPGSSQVTLKMIGAELGLISETTGSFGSNGEGLTSSILNRGYTTAITCTPIK